MNPTKKNMTNLGLNPDQLVRLVTLLLLLLLFAWPIVRGVCLNHEVAMFQPRTVTPLYLGSIINCYVSYSTLLKPLCPSPPSSWFPSGGGVPAPAPGHSPVYFRSAYTQDNFTTWASPVFVPASRDPSLPDLSSGSSASLSPPPLPRLLDLCLVPYCVDCCMD